MELRSLKALLGALRDAGVTSYREGDVSIELAGALPAPAGDVEGDPGDLALPAGVLDVQAELARIKREYSKQKGRSS